MQNTICRVVSLFVGFFACAVLLSGCFAPAEASPGDTTQTVTPTHTATLMPTLPAGPAVVPTQVQATSAPLVIAQGVTEPQMTQTVFQATQFAIGTQLIVGITTTYEANLTLTATFAGTPAGAQPQDQGNPTLAPTFTLTTDPNAAPQGVAGQAGSGAAGIIGADCVYTVVEGDRLFRIALRFGLATEVVVRANGIVNPDLIHPNDRYLIPNCNATPIPATRQPNTAGKNVYTVVAGDTLFSLAARNNTTVQAIAQANGITNVNLIIVGQQLVMP